MLHRHERRVKEILSTLHPNTILQSKLAPLAILGPFLRNIKELEGKK